MFTEDDLLPISALQHLAFCERQWALIYLEQVWSDNQLTAEGHLDHERAHREESEVRADLRIARGLRVHSFRLGLTGMTDVVEFVRKPECVIGPFGPEALALEGVKGWWSPMPVEYKHGKPKAGNCDSVQLCGQALCLEEMLGVRINEGAMFYGLPRRRTSVAFDDKLRRETESLAVRLHECYKSGVTPAPVFGKKCKNCSLFDDCLPEITMSKTASGRYIASSLGELGLGTPTRRRRLP